MHFPLSSTRNCPASVHPQENCWSQSTHSLQRAISVVLFWKVEAVSVLYIFFLEFNHAWPAALRVCPDGTSSTATVVHALRRRLVATSPSTTWPDICHYHTRDGRLIYNAVTKLVQRYRPNCMLHPEVEIQSSNQTKNWSKHWISTECRHSVVQKQNQILNPTGSNRQNSNVSCCNVARTQIQIIIQRKRRIWDNSWHLNFKPRCMDGNRIPYSLKFELSTIGSLKTRHILYACSIV